MKRVVVECTFSLMSTRFQYVYGSHPRAPAVSPVHQVYVVARALCLYRWKSSDVGDNQPRFQLSADVDARLGCECDCTDGHRICGSSGYNCTDPGSDCYEGGTSENGLQRHVRSTMIRMV